MTKYRRVDNFNDVLVIHQLKSMAEKFENTIWIIRGEFEENRRRQWAQENWQKDKQWSIKHYIVSQRLSITNPTKNWGGLVCSGRVSSACSSFDTRYFILAKYTLTSHASHKWGNDGIDFMTNLTYPWLLLV